MLVFGIIHEFRQYFDEMHICSSFRMVYPKLEP